MQNKINNMNGEITESLAFSVTKQITKNKNSKLSFSRNWIAFSFSVTLANCCSSNTAICKPSNPKCKLKIHSISRKSSFEFKQNPRKSLQRWKVNNWKGETKKEVSERERERRTIWEWCWCERRRRSHRGCERWLCRDWGLESSPRPGSVAAALLGSASPLVVLAVAVAVAVGFGFGFVDLVVVVVVEFGFVLLLPPWLNTTTQRERKRE